MEQLQLIERLIQEGDVDALETIIDKLAKSTDLDMLYEAATIFASYGFMEEADFLYETLLNHLPDEAQLKIDRASILIELDKEDEALLLLSEIKPTDEEYVQALLALADYYQMTGLAETALSKVQEAYALLPNEPVIRFAYAELLLDSGRFGEAARFYSELKEEVESIGHVSISSRLAETYSAGAAYEQSIPYYEELLEENRLPDTLFGAAFAYYQLGEASKAIPLLNELIEIDPDYYSAYMLAGQAMLLDGNDEKAYKTFQKGIKRDEFDKELQLSAGKCALKMGSPDKAEQHLKDALALDPEYVDALITLASLYNENERDNDLFELLSLAKEESLDIPLLNAFLAYAYERTEQFKKAYDSFAKAYSEMKDDYEFLSKYANFLIEEGKQREAVEVVERLVTLFPEDQNWRAFLEAQTDEEV
ncbi:tetratricopeptide repeat protein [Sporosarcina sp. Marseille-Q4063]|uniref:tetratricopeptide repeat protein n=1 Tax=Sporosarcina sp. Marseille-Q4063 TaxID=2810514 RepID=UPI001BB057F1|nr:tetratricopeptide repeat protein [Sporosarcina sp. Marseille-Q4063]QUW22118.1 tetratricopeptide repeat protein [Sporosarcina sp. Marseille-Q4063]